MNKIRPYDPPRSPDFWPAFVLAYVAFVWVWVGEYVFAFGIGLGMVAMMVLLSTQRNSRRRRYQLDYARHLQRFSPDEIAQAAESMHETDAATSLFLKSYLKKTGLLETSEEDAAHS